MAKKVVEPASTEDNTVENLQKTIADLKERNMKLEGEKAELFKQSQQIREVERIIDRIVEIPVERLIEVEKIKEIKVRENEMPSKFKPGDFVFYPEIYQRMNFEIRAKQGYGDGQPLYRLLNHERLIDLEFVPENRLRKL